MQKRERNLRLLPPLDFIIQHQLPVFFIKENVHILKDRFLKCWFQSRKSWLKLSGRISSSFTGQPQGPLGDSLTSFPGLSLKCKLQDTELAICILKADQDIWLLFRLFWVLSHTIDCLSQYWLKGKQPKITHPNPTVISSSTAYESITGDIREWTRNWDWMYKSRPEMKARWGNKLTTELPGWIRRGPPWG